MVRRFTCSQCGAEGDADVLEAIYSAPAEESSVRLVSPPRCACGAIAWCAVEVEVTEAGDRPSRLPES